MAYPEHLRILKEEGKESISAENIRLQNNICMGFRIDLKHVEQAIKSFHPEFYYDVFNKGNLINLSKCNLSGIDLSGANCSNVNFFSSDLTDVNFSGTNCSGANFYKAILNDVTGIIVSKNTAFGENNAKLQQIILLKLALQERRATHAKWEGDSKNGHAVPGIMKDGEFISLKTKNALNRASEKGEKSLAIIDRGMLTQIPNALYPIESQDLVERSLNNKLSIPQCEGSAIEMHPALFKDATKKALVDALMRLFPERAVRIGRFNHGCIEIAGLKHNQWEDLGFKYVSDKTDETLGGFEIFDGNSVFEKYNYGRSPHIKLKNLLDVFQRENVHIKEEIISNIGILYNKRLEETHDHLEDLIEEHLEQLQRLQKYIECISHENGVSLTDQESWSTVISIFAREFNYLNDKEKESKTGMNEMKHDFVPPGEIVYLGQKFHIKDKLKLVVKQKISECWSDPAFKSFVEKLINKQFLFNSGMATPLMHSMVQSAINTRSPDFVKQVEELISKHELENNLLIHEGVVSVDEPRTNITVR